MWKWNFLIYFPKSTKKHNRIFSNTIKSRSIKDENKPGYFKNEQNTRLEKEVPTWDISYNDMLPFYVNAYKERFIEWKNLNEPDCTKINEIIIRRIPWLYPDECKHISISIYYKKPILNIFLTNLCPTDCWTRAYHFARKITELVREHYQKEDPSKTFADPYIHYMYGTFIYKVEKGDPGETVRWKFHVAPIIKLKDSELYLLDPLISEGPMKKNEYHAKIGNPENQQQHPIHNTLIRSELTGYVTCKPETYDFEHDCFEPANNVDPYPDDPDIDTEKAIEIETNEALLQ